ncbi:MAG: hypothetical protein WCI22_03065 [Actinomycetota bacterium]
MATLTPGNRRRVGVFTRGAIWSAAALAVGASVVATSRVDAAATNAGAVAVIDNLGATLTSGGSATEFGLRPPNGAACTGDTATGGYKFSTYMVPAAVDPATLTFDNNGPIPNATGNPTPSAFRQPLYAAGSPIVNKNTSIDSGSGGLLVNLPLFSFAGVGFAVGDIPAGSYNVGYACIKGQAGPTQLDKYWNAQITFSANGGDPIGVVWASGSPPPTTTTTPATTTTVGGSTTTTASSSTSSTVVDTSTTASSDSSTSVVDTTAASESSTTDALGSGSGGGLVSTGIDATKLLVWALIALVLGRIVVLIARRVRVVPPDQR